MFSKKKLLQVWRTLVTNNETVGRGQHGIGELHSWAANANSIIKRGARGNVIITW